MTNNIRADRELSHWREWQDRSDAIWGWQTPAGRIRADRRAELFRSLGRMGPHSLVLELGCGTGEFTARLARHVGALVATDLSPDLLKRAAARVTTAGWAGRVSFDVQDATGMSLADRQFEAVFGCSVLHHVDPAPALREVHRVLKPSCWCVFSEPNMLNPQIAIQKNVAFIKRRAGDSPDETAFFRAEAVRLLEAAGFVEITVRCFDFLHPATPPGLIPLVAQCGLALERLPVFRNFSGSLIMCARRPDDARG